MQHNCIRILGIDNDPAISRLLKRTFNAQNIAFEYAKTGKCGLQKLDTFHPELILLDIDLKDITGKELIQKILCQVSTPVVVLTENNQESKIVEFLNLGANDYITKPFNPNDLVAKIRAIWRREVLQRQDMIYCGGLTIDLMKNQVMLGGKAINLSSTEWVLLKELARANGEPLSYEELTLRLKKRVGKRVSSQINARYIRQYVAFIRKKLDDSASSPRYIFTEYNFGYRLNAE
nr:response regulator transcription factor [uncultured Anaeromusa sp.]